MQAELKLGATSCLLLPTSYFLPPTSFTTRRPALTFGGWFYSMNRFGKLFTSEIAAREEPHDSPRLRPTWTAGSAY
jgi:hypothetical protein